jgi:DNA-binding NarL/FixJ family response regulator/anti-anti-sigma regulatory factor
LASILIVDDSLIMRRNLRTILERNGHVIVAEATNGEDAIRLYALHQPDLVTMDITMPVLNGIEAVRRIITAHPKACIIVISAFDQRNMLFEAMDNGAKQYMIKPITETKLIQAVSTALETVPDHHQQTQIHTPTAATPHTYPSSSPHSSHQHPIHTITVTNQNGRFIIQLPQPLLPEHMTACKAALQGLMFIRPLLLTIDLSFTSVIPSWAIQHLRAIADNVQQVSGHLLFITSNPELHRQLSSHMPSIEIQDVSV